MKGIPQHVFSHCFSLPSFRSSLLGLEPGQNPWCLVLRPNEAQASDGSLQKNSARDTEIGEGWVCSDLERSIVHRMWAIKEDECGGHGMWYG